MEERSNSYKKDKKEKNSCFKISDMFQKPSTIGLLNENSNEDSPNSYR